VSNDSAVCVGFVLKFSGSTEQEGLKSLPRNNVHAFKTIK
jgi:hypothetical protein